MEGRESQALVVVGCWLVKRERGCGKKENDVTNTSTPQHILQLLNFWHAVLTARAGFGYLSS
jgi:hypothetical protein